MKINVRSTSRVLISSTIAAVGIALAAKFAIVAPVVAVAERAAFAKTCQVVWAGFSNQEVEYNDPSCLPYVAREDANHGR